MALPSLLPKIKSNLTILQQNFFEPHYRFSIVHRDSQSGYRGEQTSDGIRPSIVWHCDDNTSITRVEQNTWRTRGFKRQRPRWDGATGSGVSSGVLAARALSPGASKSIAYATRGRARGSDIRHEFSSHGASLRAISCRAADNGDDARARDLLFGSGEFSRL